MFSFCMWSLLCLSHQLAETIFSLSATCLTKLSGNHSSFGRVSMNACSHIANCGSYWLLGPRALPTVLFGVSAASS